MSVKPCNNLTKKLSLDKYFEVRDVNYLSNFTELSIFSGEIPANHIPRGARHASRPAPQGPASQAWRRSGRRARCAVPPVLLHHQLGAGGAEEGKPMLSVTKLNIK